jgi:RNAse (barnase) inhibitor barstar
MIMSTFIFKRAEDVVQAGDVAVLIPGDISNRDMLFQRLAEDLGFPDYFGKNWDALSDCLRDFHWRNEHRIVIAHSGLPKLRQGDVKTYLEILSDAVEDWRRTGDRDLVVAFPPDTRQAVENILHDYSPRPAD